MGIPLHLHFILAFLVVISLPMVPLMTMSTPGSGVTIETLSLIYVWGFECHFLAPRTCGRGESGTPSGETS